MTGSIVLIDGTGLVSEADYDNEMRNGYDNTNARCINRSSFINKIHDACQAKARHGGTIKSRYFRGPGQAGAVQSGRTCASILEDIKVWFNANPDFRKGPIYVAGYSRGGYVAIEYARWLMQENLKIRRMFLFDAVERDVSMDIAKDQNVGYGKVMWYVAPEHSLMRRAAQFFNNTAVPANVELAYHAMRDPSVWSRWYFDNCGKTGNVVAQHFKGTHAALGGIPWTGDHPQMPKFDLGKTMATLKQGVMSGKALLPGGAGLVMADALGKSVSLQPTTNEKADFAASDAVWTWMSRFLTVHHVI